MKTSGCRTAATAAPPLTATKRRRKLPNANADTRVLCGCRSHTTGPAPARPRNSSSRPNSAGALCPVSRASRMRRRYHCGCAP